GLEPTTLRLTAECSTIELLRSKVSNVLYLIRPAPLLSNFASRLFRNFARPPQPNANWSERRGRGGERGHAGDSQRAFRRCGKSGRRKEEPEKRAAGAVRRRWGQTVARPAAN